MLPSRPVMLRRHESPADLRDLRTTNAKGQIVPWLKQKYAAAVKTGEYHDSLEKCTRE